MGPLAGVKVVEFGQYIAAPAGAQTLLDLGAEVVKVEPPAGDAARHIGSHGEGIVRAYNRGKQSIALDLRNDNDFRVARGLVLGADVVVQNLRYGALAELGLGPGEMRAARPDLVYVSVSGFPPGTGSRHRAGLDIAAQAESGIMSLTGEGDGDPQRVGFPLVDASAGSAVVQAVLTGLLQRARTGQGTTSHISLLNVALAMQSAMWGEWSVTGTMPRRKGNGQAAMAPAADLVRTSDGVVMVSAYTQIHFRKLCDALGHPEWACDERFAVNQARLAHRAELLRLLNHAMGRWTTADCVRRLGDAGLVIAEVRDFDQVRDASDVVEGGLLAEEIDENGRPFQVPGMPFSIEGYQPPARRRVPVAGEHSARVRESGWARGR
ncbi:CaiB/BaiF CoA transferase family protein [Amycolatopsis benzoatilytica]|uniref:CaiB/BaiF CoA transferase family protein n=1 Tax=Amycolatopsis benzoatilytica TaxID=346045 RepID=UPI0003802423|nr:CoA transferase [Amycolatopsis benzoatilytica]